MKYAIRVSRLPPAVIYATVHRSINEVLTALEVEDTGSPFQTCCNIVHWLRSDILCDKVQLVEDTSIVFTDKRDADVLIVKTDKGFEVV